MSATPPPTTLEGTQTPSPFEVLWDRYKSLILVVIGAILLALVGNYAWKYFQQKEVDEKWASYAASLGLRKAYEGDPAAFALSTADLSKLEEAAKSAPDEQRPYLLLATARKAMVDKEWSRAEAALASLETGFPKHSLVSKSDFPMQGRDVIKRDPDDEDQPNGPTFHAPKAGSVVSLLREQIAAARGFAVPSSFEKPAIPADAPKVKFTVGTFGDFVIALMPQAAKHTEEFLALANQEEGAFWKDVAIDMVQRASDNNKKQAHSLHFGFASTKDSDRTKWTTTEPSEHQVEYESTGLSHFEGAVSGRPGEDGKSCVDRIWISVDDQGNLDGTQVVFGYVVEGLDVLRNVCVDADLSAQDQDVGRGQPTGNIRITAVEVLGS
ncbi:MAG: peptidylprolyl isomerase [Planctomycetota bacterium]